MYKVITIFKGMTNACVESFYNRDGAFDRYESYIRRSDIERIMILDDENDRLIRAYRRGH